MNNTEKGFALAALFPDRLQEILDYIEKVHYHMVEHKEKVMAEWGEQFVSVGLWYTWAHEVYGRIKAQANQLLKAKRFADQLFSGYHAAFTIDCIVKYAHSGDPNSSFFHLVKALFDAND